jgi:hypothetical protein
MERFELSAWGYSWAGAIKHIQAPSCQLVMLTNMIQTTTHRMLNTRSSDNMLLPALCNQVTDGTFTPSLRMKIEHVRETPQSMVSDAL